MRVAMYDLEGHLLETFKVESQKELSDLLKVNPSSLSSCLNGTTLSTSGKQFRRLTEEKMPLKRVGNIVGLEQGSMYNPVNKYYNDNYICTYDNVSIAAMINGLHQSGISKCLIDNKGTCGGYSWKYATKQTETK